MVLQTLRKGASGLVAKAFLILLTISFVIWGIADVFRGYGTNAVAKIGETEIPVTAFRQQYLDQIQRISRSTGRPISQEQARAFGIDRQVLNQMIGQTALDEDIRRRGLALSDTEIAREIRANPSYRRPGAAEFEPAYFEQLLRANGLTEVRFIGMEKQRVLREAIVESLAGNVTAPAVLREAIHRYEGERRDVSYLAVGPQAAGTLPEPTDAQLQAFYDTHKVTFRAPEYRSVAVLALTPQSLAQWIDVSDADLKAAYDANPGRFRHAGTPQHPADRVLQCAGGAGGRRQDQGGRELPRHRRRARPRPQGHRSRPRHQGRPDRSAHCGCRLHPSGGRHQRAPARRVRVGTGACGQHRPLPAEAVRRGEGPVAPGNRAGARPGANCWTSTTRWKTSAPPAPT